MEYFGDPTKVATETNSRVAFEPTAYTSNQVYDEYILQLLYVHVYGVTV